MPKPVPNTQTGSLTDHEHGTNDTLIGVDNTFNTLYGDAFAMYDHSRGGNDKLIGGTGPGGNTIFVQRPFMATPTRCTTPPAAATTI